MNRHLFPSADVHETTRRRAAELRAEAYDAAWNQGSAVLRRTLRSATRLAASLARHERLRRAA